MSRLVNGLCCCAAAWLLGVVPAQAGTVRVADGAISYTAAPGEANVVTVTPTGLTETGAPLSVGAGCTLANPTTATCTVASDAGVAADLGDGDDTLDGDGTSRPLSVRGGPGADTITGGLGADNLFGDEDADTLVGDESTSSVNNDDQEDDLLDGGPGADSMSGGDHADVFDQGPVLDGTDTINGGDGFDTVAYDARDTAVVVDLHALAGRGGQSGEDDVLVGVEDAYGGAGEDALTGSDADNVLVGGEGGDRIIGGPGFDVLDGEGGPDRLFARDSFIDRVECGAGDDRADVDAGADILRDCEAEPAPAPAHLILTSGQVAPFTPPALSVGVSARPGIRRGILRVRVSSAARAMLTATVQGTVGKRRVRMSAAGAADNRGTAWLSLRLTPSAWRHIRRTRRGVQLQLTVTGTRSGETATARATIRVFGTRVLPWPLRG
ncbi:MAG: hypothetical protein JHC84_12405 [Solirubrobacteraceae bacterium]|nr:hypothetical protein [Solirubrobacteraceae bacterium]